MAPSAEPHRPPSAWGGAAFALGAGACLGLAMQKFGNPIILDQMVARPHGLAEVVFTPWPLAWGYALLAVLVVVGLGWRIAQGAAWRFPRPLGITLLLVAWVGWQWVSGLATVDAALTRATLTHFVALVGWFGVGWLGLAAGGRPGWFFAGITVGLTWALWTGFGQHFGGLEATRHYIYQYTDWRQLSPDALKRIASNRVFGPLVYANAFAGLILLVSPVALITAWQATGRWSPLLRKVVVGTLAYAAVACLVWTGSKSGWLIALLVGAVCLLDLNLARWASLHPKLSLGRKHQWALVAVLLGVGGVGFFVKFSGYFAKGATSVTARMHYWTAAWKTFAANPVLGSGPGTFSKMYARIKPPEAEMARLAHNDYLEQASDSGLPGCLAYTGFVVGSLAWLRRRVRPDPRAYSVWLGLLAAAAHGLTDFGLYIPALSWTVFCWYGWLWGRYGEGGGPTAPGVQGGIDKRPVPA